MGYLGILLVPVCSTVPHTTMLPHASGRRGRDTQVNEGEEREEEGHVRKMIIMKLMFVCHVHMLLERGRE
jgi:hypothetical protein